MTSRQKWALIIALSVIALGATAGIGVSSWMQVQKTQNTPSAVQTGTSLDWAKGDRIVFRNTAMGQGYGMVASVPLANPQGRRALTQTPCDRVDANADEFACLRSERGITPTYTATIYADDGADRLQWPLAGVPSRTRFSPDGSLVATTAFVTGHTYATVGFSTETAIHRASDGTSFESLETWKLVIDGTESAPTDRNYWGITFIDDNTFYATAGMTLSGRTYLVKGDIRTQTLTAVGDSVECPSLSPDGTRIAFKRVTSGSGATVHWTPAVRDLGTGKVTVLSLETRGIDDQIAWLNDDTLLYGVPRTDAAGDTDVWELAASGATAPRVLIEHAWSPSVVRADAR